MRDAIKVMWLEALRSKRYRKATSTLKRHFKKTIPGHCCLGVLCEVIKDDFPHAATLIQPLESVPLPGRTITGRASLLDQETLAYAGLGADQQRVLAGRNDKGASFEQIANYIEKKL